MEGRKQGETTSSWYKREFEKWLYAFKNDDKKFFDNWVDKFKKANACDDEEFEERCDKEFHQIFREFFWVPMMLERIDRENREVAELLQKGLLQKSYSVTVDEPIYADEPVLYTKLD